MKSSQATSQMIFPISLPGGIHNIQESLQEKNALRISKNYQFKNTIIQNIPQNKLPTPLVENNILKSWEIEDQLMLNNNTLNISKMCETEIFLKKDVSEEPIDLNPWCKEWSTSCLDEESTVSNIGHFISLQSLQDPKSPSELLDSHQIITGMEDTVCLPKGDMIFDIDQPILNIYSDPHSFLEIKGVSSDILSLEQNKDNVYDIQQTVSESQKANIWRVNELQNSESMIINDGTNCTNTYLNSDKQETFLNIETHDKSVMFSPPLISNDGMLFQTGGTENTMKTHETLDQSCAVTSNDIGAVTEMDLSNIAVDEAFLEHSNDFDLSSNNAYTYEEPLLEVENLTNCYSSDVHLKKRSDTNLCLKLVPDCPEYKVSTPDAIANAISLESEFNLLSYIEDDQNPEFGNDKPISEATCKIKRKAQDNKLSHLLNSKVSVSNVKRKKREKRSRPSKIEEPEIKLEITPESDHDFKYRQLRDKNNEASRRSRMLRKEREMQIITTLRDLEKHNLHLLNSVSNLEDECKKYRKRLLDAMSK